MFDPSAGSGRAPRGIGRGDRADVPTAISTAAAKASSRSSSKPRRRRGVVSAGLAQVKVPALVEHGFFTPQSRLKASPWRKITPSSAARPVPVIKAQAWRGPWPGQAMISTLTAADQGQGQRGDGASQSQARKVVSGANQHHRKKTAVTRSAKA